jgi:DUF4097 and DUF4098 domain-containing protein YvlB
MKPSQLLVALCAALSLTLAADPRYHEDFHYSYPQTAGGHFSIENFNGSVEVTGWDQNTVDVSGTKYADSQERLNAIRIEASNSGNSVQVRTIRPESDHRGNMGAKYVIHVPRQTELDRVRSSNGSLRLENITGNATAHTSNGSVRIVDLHGNVDASSSNGGVEVRGVDGQMAFHTSNGSVHAEDVRGGLRASTSNGGVHIHLRGSQGSEPIQLSTSNGSVDLELDTPHTSDLVASTSNGGITVRLPAGTNAAISAHTSGHDRIQTDFDVTVHGQLARSRLDGAIGSGGPRIDLRTSNGNIRLLKI